MTIRTIPDKAMLRRVCCVTGTRAEYGLLRWVNLSLNNCQCDLKLGILRENIQIIRSKR